MIRPRSFLDPYLLALVGAVLLAAILPVRGQAAAVTDVLVKGAIALLFFLYGARLSTRAILAGIAHWRLQSLVFASTYLFFPLLGLLVVTLLRPVMGSEMLLGLMFLCVLPSTVQSSIAFTSIARGNVPAALCAASLSNLAGVLLTPLLVAVFLKTQGVGFTFSAVQDIAVQLLLPFIAGQIAQPLIGDWLRKHRTLTSAADRGSILLVVYAAFSKGMVAGIWTQMGWASIGLIILVSFLLLAVVLGTTTFASRRLGFSKEDEIAIVFCGSKKSMASGIPMANILFAPEAVGLIVLPLMLFHQAQLFACAILAQRYAQRPDNPGQTSAHNSRAESIVGPDAASENAVARGLSNEATRPD